MTLMRAGTALTCMCLRMSLVTTTVSAQGASIDGYVFSRDSMPIFGVLVTSPSVTQETRTDSSG